MYKIKYFSPHLKRFLYAFFLALFFIGGFLLKSYLFEKNCLILRAELEQKEEMLNRLELEFSELRGDGSQDREVWLDFIEVSDYIRADDRIDVRGVDPLGKDTKILSSKLISQIDEEGLSLIVEEAELEILSGIRTKLKSGELLRVYAVRHP